MRMTMFSRSYQIALVLCFLWIGANGFVLPAPYPHRHVGLAHQAFGSTAKPVTSTTLVTSVDTQPKTSRREACDDAVPAPSDRFHLSKPLFTFYPDGNEINDLLPPLGRRLDLGVKCYYEESDRPVIYLLHKAKGAVRAQDACWALEACQGNQVEALIRLSVAQRFLRSQTAERKQIATNLHSTNAVPLEWQFRRHLSRRTKSQRKRRGKLTTTGGLLARVALFLGLCRFVFGAKVFFLAP